MRTVLKPQLTGIVTNQSLSLALSPPNWLIHPARLANQLIPSTGTTWLHLLPIGRNFGHPVPRNLISEIWNPVLSWDLNLKWLKLRYSAYRNLSLQKAEIREDSIFRPELAAKSGLGFAIQWQQPFHQPPSPPSPPQHTTTPSGNEEQMQNDDLSSCLVIERMWQIVNVLVWIKSKLNLIAFW